MPESPSKVVTPTHFQSQKKYEEVDCLHWKKESRKICNGDEIGLVTVVSEVPRGALSHANESPEKQCFGGRLALLVPT